jgi:glycerol-3-phosphate dehydrogenase
LLDEVLEPIVKNSTLSERLIENLPYLKAEILYAVTHEGARSVDDVLSRRTRIAFEASDQGLSALEDVATLIASPLGWNAADKKSSIKEYRELVERQNEMLNIAKKTKTKVS